MGRPPGPNTERVAFRCTPEEREAFYGLGISSLKRHALNEWRALRANIAEPVDDDELEDLEE